MNPITIGVGARPHQRITVTTRDGETYDLGLQVAGTDLIARFYQWQQTRRINAYCRDRIKTLTGVERDEFVRELETRRG